MATHVRQQNQSGQERSKKSFFTFSRPCGVANAKIWQFVFCVQGTFVWQINVQIFQLFSTWLPSTLAFLWAVHSKVDTVIKSLVFTGRETALRHGCTSEAFENPGIPRSSFWGLCERPHKCANDPKSAILEVLTRVYQTCSQVCFFFGFLFSAVCSVAKKQRFLRT